jgi:hypothetical protein
MEITESCWPRVKQQDFLSMLNLVVFWLDFLNHIEHGDHRDMLVLKRILVVRGLFIW